MSEIPIDWNNFHAKKIRDSHQFTAMTFIDYNMHYKYEPASPDSGIMTISFHVAMNEKQSYVSKYFLKTADAASKIYLLNHERGHWIITMVYFKKLITEIQDFQFDGRVKFELDSICRQNRNLAKAEQVRYDHETLHSKNKAEQAAWEAKLLTQLFDAYGKVPEFPQDFTITKQVKK